VHVKQSAVEIRNAADKFFQFRGALLAAEPFVK